MSTTPVRSQRVGIHNHARMETSLDFIVQHLVMITATLFLVEHNGLSHTP